MRGRRAIRGTWAMLAGGLALHVAGWAMSSGVSLGRIVPALVLLRLRAPMSVLGAVALVTAVVAATGLLEPGGVPVVAALGAIALGVRALARPELRVDARDEPPPYREAPLAPPRRQLVHVSPPRPERARLVVAAATCAHFAAWSAIGGGGWPGPHVIVLDLLLGVVTLAALVPVGRVAGAIPPLLVGIDLVSELGVLRLPRSAGELAASAIATGFLCLFVGLRVSLREARSDARGS